MFMRIPYEHYDQISMYPASPMMRSRQMTPIPKMRERAEHQVIPPGSTGGPTLEKQPGPQVLPVPKYSQNWLIEQIGKYIKVEFLIGTSMLIDREGILKEVGVNYIVLKESGTKDDLMCDMYSIKFVRVFDDQDKAIICK